MTEGIATTESTAASNEPVVDASSKEASKVRHHVNTMVAKAYRVDRSDKNNLISRAWENAKTNSKGLQGMRSRVGGAVLGEGRKKEYMKQVTEATINSEVGTTLDLGGFTIDPKTKHLQYGGVDMDRQSRLTLLSEVLSISDANDHESGSKLKKIDSAISAEQGGHVTSTIILRKLELAKHTYQELARETPAHDSTGATDEEISRYIQSALEGASARQEKLDNSARARLSDRTRRGLQFARSHWSDVAAGTVTYGGTRALVKGARVGAMLTPIGWVGAAGAGAVGGATGAAVELRRAHHEAKDVVKTAHDVGDLDNAAGVGLSAQIVAELKTSYEKIMNDENLSGEEKEKAFNKAARGATRRCGYTAIASRAAVGAGAGVVGERAMRMVVGGARWGVDGVRNNMPGTGRVGESTEASGNNTSNSTASSSTQEAAPTNTPTTTEPEITPAPTNTPDSSVDASSRGETTLSNDTESPKAPIDMQPDVLVAELKTQSGEELPHNPASAIHQALQEQLHGPDAPLPELDSGRELTIEAFSNYEAKPGDNIWWVMKDNLLVGHPELSRGDLDNPEIASLIQNAVNRLAEEKGVSVESLNHIHVDEKPFESVDMQKVLNPLFQEFDARFPQPTSTEAAFDTVADNPNLAVANIDVSSEVNGLNIENPAEVGPALHEVAQTEFAKHLTESYPSTKPNTINELVRAQFEPSTNGSVARRGILDTVNRGPTTDGHLILSYDPVKLGLEQPGWKSAAELVAETSSEGTSTPLTHTQIFDFLHDHHYLERRGIAQGEENDQLRADLIAAITQHMQDKEKTTLALEDIDPILTKVQADSIAQQELAVEQATGTIDRVTEAVKDIGEKIPDLDDAEGWLNWIGENKLKIGMGSGGFLSVEIIRRATKNVRRKRRRARRARRAYRRQEAENARDADDTPEPESPPEQPSDVDETHFPGGQ